MQVAAQRKAQSPPPASGSGGSAAKLVLGSVTLGAVAYLLYALLQEQPPRKLTAAALARKAYSGHTALTAADMAVVVSLLRKDTALTETERLALYRCVCCFKQWLVPTVKSANGSEQAYSFAAAASGKPPAQGTGFVLCSSQTALAAIRRCNSPPRGAVHAAVTLSGASACSRRNLTLSEVQFLSLDPEVCPEESTPPRFTFLDAASNELTGMAAAVDVESRLAKLKTEDCRAARAVAGYSGFYCLAKRGDATAVTPLVLGTHVLLYTSLDLLQLAYPELAGLGTKLEDLQPTRVSMDAVLQTLRHPKAHAKGVHINRCVPHLHKRFALDGLDTQSLVEIFCRAGVKPPLFAGGLSTAAQVARQEEREGKPSCYPGLASGSTGSVREEGVLL